VHFSWKILYQDIYFKSSVMDVSKTLSKRAFSFFSTRFSHHSSSPDYLVREEIKNYSSWPTIPQVYPCIVTGMDGRCGAVEGLRKTRRCIHTRKRNLIERRGSESLKSRAPCPSQPFSSSSCSLHPPLLPPSATSTVNSWGAVTSFWRCSKAGSWRRP
jgi:hypothetical protein